MVEEQRLSARLLQNVSRVRTDILTADQFALRWDAEELFWSVWWWVTTKVAVGLTDDGMGKKELLDLSGDIEDELIQALAEFERETRLPDNVDLSDLEGGLSHELATPAYIAASRALALRRKVGYSDDVRDCLQRSWYAGRLAAPWADWLDSQPFPLTLTESISVSFLNAVVLVELARMRKLDGDYETALHSWALGATYLRSVFWLLDYEWDKELYGDLDDFLSDQDDQRTEIRQRLTQFALDGREAKECADEVINSVRGADWKQVAIDCEAIAKRADECFHLPIQLGDGTCLDRDRWEAYWHIACGRAMEKLNPSDLRDLLNIREDEASESRIRTYFFAPALWKVLPERARRSMVSADRSWFTTRSGRAEGVLNELRIALEEICRPLLWEPVVGNGRVESYRLKLRQLKLRESRENPSLDDFEAVCKEGLIREAGWWATLSQVERNFLEIELPAILKDLRKLRNTAEHDPAAVIPREAVTRVFGKLFGIGCEGIFNRLVALSVRRGRKDGKA